MADVAEFEALVVRHRRELLVHCYRLVGSLEEAEDLVQETFLRAWRGLDAFEGRSTVRAWLYRIATNACLDALARNSRRVLPAQVRPSWNAGDDPSDNRPDAEVAWLQPIPDAWLGADGTREPRAPALGEPESVVVDRETIELAFLAAIQHLPPKQRAALILRDVVGWSARQTAEALDTGVTSVNSAVQRARETLRERLPERRADWRTSPQTTEDERVVLRRYMAAVQHGDLAAVAELLAAEVQASMPPYPVWFDGRTAVMASLAASWDRTRSDHVGQIRTVVSAANRQPAFAAYVRGAADPTYRAFAISLLTISNGRIVEMTAFHDPGLFPRFDLPAELPTPNR